MVMLSDLPLRKRILTTVNDKRVEVNSRSLVSGPDFHDTISINFKSDLNLGNAAWSRRNAGELKFAEKIVVLGQRTFTLEHLDQDGGLVVSGGGETMDVESVHSCREKTRKHIHLALFGGNDGIARNQFGEHTAGGLNTERQGANIDKDDAISSLGSGEDSTLDSSTVCYSLVRIDTFRRFFAEKLLEQLLNLRDTGRASNKNNL
jgi:NAD-specific glutamate dehydrogenase